MTEDDLEFSARRSLVELMGEDWDVSRWEGVERLVVKPVGRLSASELLYLIETGCGLAFVVPVAVLRLEADVFVAGASHPGDLFTAVLSCPVGFWRERRNSWEAVAGLIARAVGEVGERAQREREVQAAREKRDLNEDNGEEYFPQLLGDDFMAAVLHFRSAFAEEGE